MKPALVKHQTPGNIGYNRADVCFRKHSIVDVLRTSQAREYSVGPTLGYSIYGRRRHTRSSKMKSLPDLKVQTLTHPSCCGATLLLSYRLVSILDCRELALPIDLAMIYSLYP